MESRSMTEAVLTYPTVARPRTRRKTWIWLGIVVAVVALISVAVYQKKVAAKNAPIPVQTDKAFRKTTL